MTGIYQPLVLFHSGGVDPLEVKAIPVLLPPNFLFETNFSCILNSHHIRTEYEQYNKNNITITVHIH